MNNPIEQAKQTPTVDCYGLKKHKLKSEDAFVLTKGEEILDISNQLETVLMSMLQDFGNKRYNRLTECGEREIKISMSVR